MLNQKDMNRLQNLNKKNGWGIFKPANFDNGN